MTPSVYSYKQQATVSWFGTNTEVWERGERPLLSENWLDTFN